MAQQIQFRRGTGAEWASANPILAQGEIGVDLDLNRFKVGTGLTSWNYLDYTAVFDVVIQSPTAPIVYPTFANASGVSAIGIASTGSTSVVYIPSSGNLGIGTTNATSKLTVSGNLLVTGIVTASEFSGNSSSATYATNAGIATNVIGGIASVTSLSVSGVTAVGVLTATRIGIGTTNPTSELYVNGDVFVTGIITSTDFNSASDIKLKSNIKKIDNPIDKIIRIDGVTFDWKTNNKSSMGVIAQNIEEVLPQLVSGEESKAVNYNGIIGLLIECVKTQQKQIENLSIIVNELPKKRTRKLSK